MLTRRTLMITGAVATAVLLFRSPAFAQGSDNATSFIQSFGTQLIGVVNGPGELAGKKQALRPLIDSAVDVNQIALFCLGRGKTNATPAETAQFTQLFHSVLINNITGKIGDYRGVTFRLTNTTQRGDEALVGTVVTRPNNSPNNVQWVVSHSSGAPKIVDVVAEGTSLRLTQRSDYASFLSQHGESIEALIGAIKHQLDAAAG
jgi:phospholipid transport system substrate-binding protein